MVSAILQSQRASVSTDALTRLMTLEDGRSPKEEEVELLALLQGVEVSTFFILNGCDLIIFSTEIQDDRL